MVNDFIKPYIVQIEGRFGKGSGVLVKGENGKYYIFTAKHNFKSTREQKVEEIEVEYIKEDIGLGEVKIISYHKIEVSDIIGLDDLSIDFIVLVVDENGFEYLNTLPIEALKIYNDSFKECTVSGYPRVSTDAIYLDCKYETTNQKYEKKDDYKHTFKVSSLYPLSRSGLSEVNTISGISGGGVFVEGKNNEIHLVGIEIEYIDIHNLVCVDLRKLKDKIDEKLIKSNIETIEEEIILNSGESFTIKMVKVDLDDNKSLYVSIYPITFEEYDLFCKYKDKETPCDRKWDNRRKRPVINVSFKDAKKYCKWLKKYSKVYKYELLSSTDWLKIAELNILKNNAEEFIWYNQNETAVIGKRSGNLGIYDMYGNVEEWCSDNVSIGGSFRDTTLNRIREKKERHKTDKFDFLGFRIASKAKKVI